MRWVLLESSRPGEVRRGGSVVGPAALKAEEGLKPGGQSKVSDDGEPACDEGGEWVEAAGDKVVPVFHGHGDGDVGCGGGALVKLTPLVGDDEMPAFRAVAGRGPTTGELKLVGGGEAFGGNGAEALNEVREHC